MLNAIWSCFTREDKSGNDEVPFESVTDDEDDEELGEGERGFEERAAAGLETNGAAANGQTASETTTNSLPSTDTLASAATLEQDLNELRVEESVPLNKNLSVEEAAEWLKWQSVIMERCYRAKWFPSKSLNRIVAPFALSMTAVMLQRISSQASLRYLERFTKLHTFDKQRLLKGFNVVTNLCKEVSQLSKKVERTDEYEIETSEIEKLASLKYDVGACFTYRVLFSSEAKVADDFLLFLKNVCNQEPKRLDFTSPKRSSKHILRDLSIAAAADLHTEFVRARRIRHDIPATDKTTPIPKLCASDPDQLFAMAGTRIRAYWEARKTYAYRINKFMLTYGVQQEHFFFGLHIPTRTITYTTFEAYSFPLTLAKNISSDMVESSLRFKLVLIKPNCVGSLSDLMRDVTANVFVDLLTRIPKEEMQYMDVLLPYIELSSVSDMFLPLDLCATWKSKRLKNFSKVTDAKTGRVPRLDKLFHCGSFRMDEKGISPAKNLNNDLPLVPDYSEEAAFADPHQKFAIRFDTPFMFVLVEESTQTPVLSGAYGGTPALPLNRMKVLKPSHAVRILNRMKRRNACCRFCCCACCKC